jgi:hypothetical protein
MKKFRKLIEYVFPHDDGGIPISLLALSAAAVSCGFVVAWLWIAHFPASLSPSMVGQRRCIDRCEKVCRESLLQR